MDVSTCKRKALEIKIKIKMHQDVGGLLGKLCIKCPVIVKRLQVHVYDVVDIQNFPRP